MSRADAGSFDCARPAPRFAQDDRVFRITPKAIPLLCFRNLYLQRRLNERRFPLV